MVTFNSERRRNRAVFHQREPGTLGPLIQTAILTLQPFLEQIAILPEVVQKASQGGFFRTWEPLRNAWASFDTQAK